MELSQRDRLSELVEELTTSGQLQLCKEKTKEIKKICKESIDCINHAYHSIMSQLNQDHAEIRLAAFHLASELFPKSHHFRTLLVDNFQEFLELTVETNFERPLPPPQPVARKLRSLAVQTIQSWQSSYGSAYKKLELGFHFLKQFKKVDFQDAEARTIAERAREAERQRKMERIYKERLEAAIRDLEDSSTDIEVALKELDSCLMLLLPQFSLLDSHTVNLPTQTSAGCLLEDEHPCCSKNLMNDTTDQIKESKEMRRKGESDSNNGEELERKKKKNKCKRSEIKELNSRDKPEMVMGQRYKMKRNENEGRCKAEEEDPLHGDSFIRHSGLISRSYCLDLDLSDGFHVEETEDNEAVVSTLLDLQRLLMTKHLPAVRRWVQIFTRSGAEQHLLTRSLDIKNSLEASLLKLSELNIKSKRGIKKMASPFEEGDDDDTDEDFIEVSEKEGYESHVPTNLQVKDGLSPSSSTLTASQRTTTNIAETSSPGSQASTSYYKRLKRLKEDERDPTCAAATLHLLRNKLSLTAAPSSSEACSTQSNNDPSTSKAPVVPFGLDLYYWGQEQPNCGMITKMTSQHQFWVPAEVEEEVQNTELMAESKCRYISFPGQFTPVRHYCNAPLENGKLCKRQDRIKCPFHGRIVPRDQAGRPCSQEDRQREEQDRRNKEGTKKHDWHDAELVRDIEIQTGENLGSDRMDKRGKRKKKKKYPNLTNLNESNNTARSRLEKRIFNKSAMRRVAQAMTKADNRKHEKFSNQFNYALN
ncbi:UV-stimulated scaffold protein A isoform X2 [Corythoichthys intestinalis]|uniref:UV-stimulated scaffold protein A isoform X2 n=1 Tax=Corythoichthys intestinalis TaxID=161448 RepID=UPI0025A5C6A8|nr:UV-stimulated scaffold protein A isoform X2 [Corythoichthys intestinalis]XP_061792725.1 UV-stimulated scaffold protein A-like [Nerophis lumbriciformis]